MEDTFSNVVFFSIYFQGVSFGYLCTLCGLCVDKRLCSFFMSLLCSVSVVSLLMALHCLLVDCSKRYWGFMHVLYLSTWQRWLLVVFRGFLWNQCCFRLFWFTITVGVPFLRVLLFKWCRDWSSTDVSSLSWSRAASLAISGIIHSVSYLQVQSFVSVLLPRLEACGLVHHCTILNSSKEFLGSCV